MEWTSRSGRRILLKEGDITKISADAIVNAANSALAGGPSIMRELDEIRRADGGCPTGSAVATCAGNLPAKYVFHAVGPIYRGGKHNEPELLAGCYRKCLDLAIEREVATISFPAISTGAFRYPEREAAAIAVREVKAHLDRDDTPIQTVIFVLFGKSAYDVYVRAMR